MKQNQIQLTREEMTKLIRAGQSDKARVSGMTSAVTPMMAGCCAMCF